jgi:hypothetical protein
MTLSLALRLGRVSNLPTVWSNVAAGLVLAGGSPSVRALALLVLAASAFYVGGMFLNDAFDAEIDAKERPERPIPSGEITKTAVMRWGFGFLALGVVLVAFVHPRAVLAALGTCGLIVLYDRFHKGNPAGPLVMGLCRVGLYTIAAYAVAPSLSRGVLVGAALLLGYVLGLTYVAKHEGSGRLGRMWPLVGLFAPLLVLGPGLVGDPRALVLLSAFGLWVVRAIRLVRRGGPSIRRAVVSLIAGISILDALLVFSAGRPDIAVFALLAFGATLASQRVISGT